MGVGGGGIAVEDRVAPWNFTSMFWEFLVMMCLLRYSVVLPAQAAVVCYRSPAGS